MALIVALLCGCGWAQDEEVVQLKSGELVKGKVLKMDDKGIHLELGTGKEMFYGYEMVNPYSAYDLRRKRLNKQSVEDHLAMADFCKRNGLLPYAVSHLKEALSRAPERKEEIQAIQKEIEAEDAKQKLKKAREIIEQKAEKRYEEAAGALHEIIEKYFESPYAEEARKLEERLTEEVKRLRKEREAAVEAAKRDQEAARKDKENKEAIEKSGAAILDAEKMWLEGLDLEAQNSSPRAVAIWTAAEAKLLFAKANIEASLKKVKDPDTIRRLSDQSKEADRWLVRIYLALGRNVAAENLDFIQSIRWINRALKIDPDNEKAYDLKLLVTETAMKIRLESNRPPR
jgi:tetratricopeptide (TPR) repeat protein